MKTMSPLSQPILRAFPYPYSAALTIANDLDNMNWDDFLEVRKFLNTSLDTSMGPGVELEIGDTFWCYTLLPYEISYFQGISNNPSPYSAILLELIKAGYIDCFHSYGDFSRWEKPQNPEYFNRTLAERAINEMVRNGISFDTYINHGDKFNIQNIFSQLLDNRGDIPGESVYHNDLTIDSLGIKFYWASDLTAVVGQERNLRVTDTDYHFFKAEHLLKGAVKSILGLDRRKRRVYGNELTRPVLLRDGRALMEFTRYCYKYSQVYIPPGRPILEKQLSDAILDKLEKLGGYMIIYTHFGQPLNRTSKGLFDQNLVARFRELKRRSSEGRLWISTTSGLLNYHYTHKYLKWDIDRKLNGEICINISGVDGPVAITPNHNGLTFYTAEPEKTSIYINRKRVADAMINPKDGTGQQSISIPIQALQFPLDIYR